MKRIIILIVTLFVSIMAFAQTQQGYVKTIGRSEMKGEALVGVT